MPPKDIKKKKDILKKNSFCHLPIQFLLESKLCEGRYPLVVQTTEIWLGSSNFGFGFWSLIYQANVSKHLLHHPSGSSNFGSKSWFYPTDAFIYQPHDSEHISQSQ